MGVDPTGRVMLPADASRALGAWGSVGAVTRGEALVLRDGEGAPVNADRRGRVTLPAWLRSACGPGDCAVIVGVRRPPAGDVAVIARVNVLDALVGTGTGCPRVRAATAATALRRRGATQGGVPRRRS